VVGHVQVYEEQYESGEDENHPTAGGIAIIGKVPSGLSVGMLVTVASLVRSNCTAHDYAAFLKVIVRSVRCIRLKASCCRVS
jgi:hypothetical protein